MMWLLAGAIAFYGYTQGWFSGLLPRASSGGGGNAPGPAVSSGSVKPPVAPVVPPVVASPPLPPPKPVTPMNTAAAPAPGLAPVVPSKFPPSFGNMVTNVSDAYGQAAAGDQYILLDGPTQQDIQRVGFPSGYLGIVTRDKSLMLVRPDVYSAIEAALNTRVQNAIKAGTSPNNVGAFSLSEIQSIISQNGLSGLGDFRRHMYVRTGRVA